MSYQVLARKWRPKSFDTLVGQTHVVRALTHALEQNRLHHAYLFTGTRGVGKTTLSRILAKALNCETGVTATPCGVCSACTEIDSGRFIDYLEMDAASNRGVDEMTALLEKAIYAPTRGRYKVYMIDEVHQLTGHAFNAMLKTLEEPPEHVKFIIATTDPQKIPVTVLSRCLQFNLKQMPPAHIVDHLTHVLTQEGIPFDAGALRHLAKAAAGSMRDALSLLDQAIAHGAGKVEEQGVRDMLGTVGDEHLYAVLDGLRSGDAVAMLNTAADMEARSLSFESALRELGVLLHRIAVAQLAPASIADEAERARLTPYAEALDAEFVQLAYQIVLQGTNDLPHAPDEATGFSMTLLRMVAFRPEQPSALHASTRQAPLLAPQPRLNVPVQPPTPQGYVPAHVPEYAPEPQAAAPRVQQAVSASTPAHAKPASQAAPAQPAALAMQAASGKQTLHADDWHNMLAQLRLQGMARQLAYHCEWLSQDGAQVTLRLGREHRALQLPAAQEKLQAALSSHLGQPIRLAIELGELASASMAQKLSAEQRERMGAAMASLEGDAFVRELIEQFDGELDEASVRPVDANPQNTEGKTS